MYETALEPDELITAVEFPLAERAGYEKFRNPASHFALVGVFVAKQAAGSVRVAVTGAASSVFRAKELEAALSKDFSVASARNVTISPDNLNDGHARERRLSRAPDPRAGGGARSSGPTRSSWPARGGRCTRPRSSLSGASWSPRRSTKRSPAWASSSTSPAANSRLRSFSPCKMQRPLFLEGEPGVGKTELAKAAAGLIGTSMLRLQCYEGLDTASALYEWDYPRQIMALRLAEASGERRRTTLYRERVPAQAPAVAGADARSAEPGRAARAPDRRNRSRRRAVRSVPARIAVGFPGVDTRIRHGARGAAAARRDDVEPHARGPRRVEAPLPVSVDRLSRARSANSRSSRRARRKPAPSCRRAPSRSCTSCARSICSRRPASRKRSTGAARLPRSP